MGLLSAVKRNRGANRPGTIGLALGGGAARGWAHLGVLRAMDELGVRADVVAGTSIGAIVGAAYACGHWREFVELATTLTRQHMLPFLTDLSFSGSGMLNGDKAIHYLTRFLDDVAIEDLPIPYAAVATDLTNGDEVVLTRGSLLKAVRASMSIPGIFKPVILNDRVLVDGELVNPIPVYVARSLGADFVLAVDINHDPMGSRERAEQRQRDRDEEQTTDGEKRTVLERVQDRLEPSLQKLMGRNDAPRAPGMLSVIADSLLIMETRVGDALLAAHPADLLIQPDVAYIQAEEFHRGEEAVMAGYVAAKQALRQLAWVSPL